MITRVSRLRVNPARASDAIEAVRAELAPAVLARPGVASGRWMVDPATGEVFIVVRWEDEEAMFRAAGDLAGTRDRLADVLRATPVSVQIHEVIGVTVHAPLDLANDAWTRIVRFEALDEMSRSDAEALFRAAGDEAVASPGFLSACWSADPTTGSGLALTTWATPESPKVEPALATTSARWEAAAAAQGLRILSANGYRTVGRIPVEGSVPSRTADPPPTSTPAGSGN